MTAQDAALVDMIDQLVREKTFSLDGLEAVKKLKDVAAAQQAELEKLRRQVEDCKTLDVATRRDLATLREQLGTMASRELAVREREAKTSDLEKRAAVAEAQSGAYLTTLGIVFKNTTVRETVLGGSATPRENGMQAYSSSNSTRTVETE